MGERLVDIQGFGGVRDDKQEIILESKDSGEPELRLSNTNADANGPVVNLKNTNGNGTTDSGDSLGTINFVGRNAAGNADLNFGKLSVTSSTSFAGTNSSNGKLTLNLVKEVAGTETDTEVLSLDHNFGKFNTSYFLFVHRILNYKFNANFGAQRAGGNNVSTPLVTDLLTPKENFPILAQHLASLISDSATMTAANGTILGFTPVDNHTLTDGASDAVAANGKVTILSNTSIASNLQTAAQATQLQDGHEFLIVFGKNCVLEDTHTIKIQTATDNHTLGSGGEGVVNDTAGNYTTVTKGTITDNKDNIVLTATGDSTIVKGSFIYGRCSGGAEKHLCIKACVLVSAGAVAVGSV